MQITYIIPCYRSAGTIKTVVDEIETTMKTLPNYNHEIILINDDSPDDTFDVIKSLCHANPHLTGINLARNAVRQ